MLADAALGAARRQGYVVLIEQTASDREAEIELLSGPQASMMDGLLFFSLGLSLFGAGVLELP